MQLFDCKVRLAGNALNEVIKQDVSAPEVEVLRALHGFESVLDLDYKGEMKPIKGEDGEVIQSVQDQVREQLELRYGGSRIGDENPQPVLHAVFGRSRTFPAELEGFEVPAEPKAKRTSKKDDANLFS